MPREIIPPATPASRRAQRGLPEEPSEPANGTPPAKAREPRASRNFQEMLDPETRLAAFFRSWGGKRGA